MSNELLGDYIISVTMLQLHLLIVRLKHTVMFRAKPVCAPKILESTSGLSVCMYVHSARALISGHVYGFLCMHLCMLKEETVSLSKFRKHAVT